MSSENPTDQENWLYDQITGYQKLQPVFKTYAQTLNNLLTLAARERAPLGIVQARAKQVGSFAEKIQRKMVRFRDPASEFNPLAYFTDLCGARVITHTASEVDAVCRFIENHFEIDPENSVKISQRLRPSEFGYRSVHYVVQFKPDVFPTAEICVDIPPELYPSAGNPCPMKAEIQVRTLLEHAWAVFSHERVYKGQFDIPEIWQRELAGLAAMLEEADKAFERIQDGLQQYAASYGDYLTPQQIQKEINLLKFVQQIESGTQQPQNNQPCLAGDPKNAHRIAHLDIAVGEFEDAIQLLQPLADEMGKNPEAHPLSTYQPVLRDLGIACCKAHKKGSPGYLRGQEYLEQACKLLPIDADAAGSLAGTYRRAGDLVKARELYRQAYQSEPSNPYAVSNYLISEILLVKNITPVQLMLPAIKNAMQRGREQVTVGMNIPWALYDQAMFHLLLQEPYEALILYARAVQKSTASWMVGTSLETLESLSVIAHELPGYEWVHNALLMCWQARFPDPDVMKRLQKLVSQPNSPHAPPVVIMAGGTDRSVEEKLLSYHDLLVEAFADFQGTIISGGTQSGIAGLAGMLQDTHPDHLHTVGYLPNLIPSSISIDKRYHELRRTQGSDFSPLEPVQYWIDLVASGIQPAQVKMLGLNGGLIAAAEFRLALALGAFVGILAGSGRSADELLADPAWNRTSRLVRLENNPGLVHAFINPGRLPVSTVQREAIASGIHQEYCQYRVHNLKLEDAAMHDWEVLREDFKNSNIDQADHIPAKLRRIGCSLRSVQDREPVLIEFTETEIDTMAEMEHSRWWMGRLLDGWRCGPRDPEKKTSPYLVPWKDLSNEDRDTDRFVVRNIPRLLADQGFEIYRID
jgi:ppGpp synthetase/RelA/SpoT-type nucleotidyltranferase